MRIFKLTLIALAAIVWSGSAWAITVKKRIEAPGLPPALIYFASTAIIRLTCDSA